MSFLEFDDSHVPQSPDFRLVYSDPDLFLKPGPSVSLEVKVLRLYGSTGNIRIITSGGPPGLAVTSVAPDFLNAGGNDTTTIGIIINGNAPEALSSPTNVLNVTGFPDPSAGPTDVTLEIAINIIETYDLQIMGTEITQGIQNFDLPPKANPDFPGIVTYDGVSLAANCRTTVLVYPSFRTLPSGPIPPSFGVRLDGFSSMTGSPLPGAFLFLEALSSRIFRDDVVTPLARLTSGTRYTLPPSWTNLGPTTLGAEIFDTSGSNSISPAMTSETNPNNNSFTMINISFFKTENLFISPIALKINDLPNPVRCRRFIGATGCIWCVFSSDQALPHRCHKASHPAISSHTERHCSFSVLRIPSQSCNCHWTSSPELCRQ